MQRTCAREGQAGGGSAVGHHALDRSGAAAGDRERDGTGVRKRHRAGDDQRLARGDRVNQRSAIGARAGDERAAGVAEREARRTRESRRVAAEGDRNRNRLVGGGLDRAAAEIEGGGRGRHRLVQDQAALIHDRRPRIGIRRSGERQGGVRRDLDADHLGGAAGGDGAGDDGRTATAETEGLVRCFVVGETRAQIQHGAARERIGDGVVIGTRLDDDGARKGDGFIAGKYAGGVIGDGERNSRAQGRTVGKDAAVGQTDAAGIADTEGRQAEEAT